MPQLAVSEASLAIKEDEARMHLRQLNSERKKSSAQVAFVRAASGR